MWHIVTLEGKLLIFTSVADFLAIYRDAKCEVFNWIWNNYRVYIFEFIRNEYHVRNKILIRSIVYNDLYLKYNCF